MVKNVLTQLFKLSWFVFLVSCDELHQKDYYVKNNLTQDIEVIFSIENIGDSSVKVTQNESELIFEYLYLFGRVGVKDERQDDPVNNLRIQLANTIVDLQEESWQYSKLDKFHAEYWVVIDSTLIGN